MLNDLLNVNIFAFLLVFVRVGTAMSVMPGFGSSHISMPVKLTFALLVSFIATPPLMMYLPTEPDSASVLVLLIASEALIGVFLGIIPRILLAAMQTAGSMISLLASMANAFIMDPVADQQSSVISSYYSTIAITVIFVTNTHHLMLAAVFDSYMLFNPTQGPIIGDMTDVVAMKVAESFRIGIQMSAPLLVSGVAYYLVLGIMGRLMPQLPVFFFGMPIQIAMQIYIMMIALPAMVMVFMNMYVGTLRDFAPSWGG